MHLRPHGPVCQQNQFQMCWQNIELHRLFPPMEALARQQPKARTVDVLAILNCQ